MRRVKNTIFLEDGIGETERKDPRGCGRDNGRGSAFWLERHRNDDGIWNVYFVLLQLGWLHERHMRIEDEYGRLKRLKM